MNRRVPVPSRASFRLRCAAPTQESARHDWVALTNGRVEHRTSSRAADMRNGSMRIRANTYASGNENLQVRSVHRPSQETAQLAQGTCVQHVLRLDPCPPRLPHAMLDKCELID